MSYLNPTRPPGGRSLFLGVLFPVFVVLLELATGWCAQAFFDPLPSFGHVVVVLCVPAINFALWRAAREEDEDADDADAPDWHASPWLAVAGGAGIAISAAYALLFLPLLPIAFLGILLFGVGLLPFSPLLAGLAGVRLIARLTHGWANAGRLMLGGGGIALIALIAIDVPATATYLALGWSVEGGPAERRGVRLMRALGDRQMLLRLCYGDDGRATGLVSVFASVWQDGFIDEGARVLTGTAAARELYFRATGEPFNAAPMPSGARRGGRRQMFAFDGDQGGTIVGGRVRDLSLVQSRIDGSISAADNVGYVEWMADFRNAGAQQAEARLTLALPAGAVASRATLWVNGEPREASVAGRGAARAAYQSVVSARRDPLLVTTDGADRLLVQAFPIQPDATLRLRIGISAPLAIAADGTRSLALPTIADRNFEIAPDFAHSLWVEADASARVTGGSLRRAVLANGATRLQGQVTDAVLSTRPPRIAVDRIARASTVTATLPAKPGQPALGVLQTIAQVPAQPPRALVVLLDGSAGNRAAGPALLRALERVPAGHPVGLVIAADTPVAIDPAPWSPAHRARIADAIGDAGFAGGQDIALALALEVAPDAGSDLLWVHAQQPVDFTRSAARIDQVFERSENLPRLARYQSVPGPAFRIEDRRWFDEARVVPATGNVAADLAGIVADLTSTAPRWTVARSEAPATGGAPGSPHIVRLWGAARIADAPVEDGRERTAAIALARRLNVVTPVSGAVVLERDAEYAANGLEVPDAADVPTVPEPGTWALIIVLCLLFGWILHRRGFRLPALRLLAQGLRLA